jgi:hypothetical protein
MRLWRNQDGANEFATRIIGNIEAGRRFAPITVH